MQKHNPHPAFNLGQCTPTREQTWLLQSAVLSGDPGRQAWLQWRTHVNLDDVDSPSYRLLPLVYRNLQKLGAQDPLLGRLKGMYRRTWYKNQMLFHQAQRLVTQFQEAGICTMFLNGAAMSIHYYRDIGMRSMNAVDIMVPDAQFDAATQCLLQQNWQLKFITPPTMNWYRQHHFVHAVSFKKDECTLNLHVQLLPFVPQRDACYWNTAVRQNWCGKRACFLSTTEQLFHTCVHGVQWNYDYLLWIPDALRVLNTKIADIEWPALVNRAEETRMIVPLRNTLAYVADVFQTPVPTAVLQQLGSMPVSWVEQQEYKATNQASTTITALVKRSFFLGCRYQSLNQTEQKPIGLSLMGWTRLYSVKWRLESRWQLPGRLVASLRQKLNRRPSDS
jgi:hypothetical protein